MRALLILAAVTLAGAAPHPRTPQGVMSVDVGDGETVVVQVEQETADVELEIAGPDEPDGTRIVDSRRPPRAERALLAAPGHYRVARRAAAGQAPRPLAPIVISRRPRVDSDAARAARERDVARAAAMLRSGAPADAVQARTLLEQALADPLVAGDALWSAELRARLGEILLASGQAAAAQEQLQRALQAFEEHGDRPGAVDARIQLGLVESWLGNTAGAIDWYERARSDAEAVHDRVSLALLEGNLGTAAVYLGESQNAIEHFRRAIDLARACGARRPEGWALTNLARQWLALGDVERAWESAEAALPAMEAAADTKGRVAALVNAGMIRTAQSRAGDAVILLSRGLDLAVASGQKQAEATVRGRLAEALAARGDVEAARSAYRDALALYEAQHARRAQGLMLAGLGTVELRADTAAASRSLEKALDLARASADPAIEAQALKGLAAAALAGGDLAQARARSAASLEVIESARLQVIAPELRTSYHASVQEYYEQAIAILVASHRADPEGGYAAVAFDVSERARARSLLDGLAAGRIEVSSGVDPERRQRERALQQSLTRASARLMRRRAGGRDGEIAEAEADLARLLAQQGELRAELRARDPRYAALTQPAPLHLDEIQRDVLDDQTALLQVALGDVASHAFVVTADACRIVDLPPRADLEALAREVHEAWSVRPGVGASARRRRDAAQRLSHALLAPIGTIPGPRLVVVAQGALQYVPFAALPTTDGGDPLIANHEIVTLPSASVLAQLRRDVAGRTPAAGRVAVLADPVVDRGDPRLPASAVRGEDASHLARLPFTRREAAAIARTAGTGGVLTALGFDASRELALSPALSRYQVLHFATHGVLNDAHPELSGLVLSLFDRDGRPREGTLRLADVYNLDLPADLVVLSACRTGLGKTVRGEGLVGLSRAFMYAGATRVLASLWTVDDAATAVLMAELYRILWTDGRPAAEALRRAQAHMRRDPRFRDPYYWAAFTLQGEWR